MPVAFCFWGIENAWANSVDTMLFGIWLVTGSFTMLNSCIDRRIVYSSLFCSSSSNSLKAGFTFLSCTEKYTRALTRIDRTKHTITLIFFFILENFKVHRRD